VAAEIEVLGRGFSFASMQFGSEILLTDAGKLYISALFWAESSHRACSYNFLKSKSKFSNSRCLICGDGSPFMNASRMLGISVSFKRYRSEIIFFTFF
jgi:hypothetical protein